SGGLSVGPMPSPLNYSFTIEDATAVTIDDACPRQSTACPCKPLKLTRDTPATASTAKTCVHQGHALGSAIEIGLESHEEAGRLATGHNRVIEGERQRQDAPHSDLALTGNDALIDATGADDRHLRRHHDEIGKSPADHAEI